MNEYIKFIIIFSLSVGQVLLVIIGFNWWVDPYGAFHASEYDPQKPVWMSKQLRLAKVHRLNQLKPQGLVLGTSSSQLGIDPDHPGWDKDVNPKYNVAMPGASLYETFRYFQHSNALNPPKQILIGLNFFAFNIFFPLSDDFKESNMVVSSEGKRQNQYFPNLALTLLSSSAIKASQKKLFYRGEGTHFSNGREIPEKNNLQSKTNRSVMMWSATKAVSRLIMPPPAHHFCLDDGMENNSNLQYLKKILEISKKNETDVRLFIHPTHVYLLEALRVLGKMEDYEKWQHALIALVEDVNSRHPESREFPLWNFGGYNSVTMTAVPSPKDSNISMRWFRDIGHYSKNLGDLIQDRIFNFHQTGRMVPEDFGIQINSKNIDRHQKAQKSLQRTYMKTYQEEIKELTDKVNAEGGKIKLFDCNQLARRLQTKS